jgi:hypothetical protein
MYQKDKDMISNTPFQKGVLLGGKKGKKGKKGETGKKKKKPQKRKVTSSAPLTRTQVLEEVGAQLHKKCMQLCKDDPNKFLLGMAYSPHLFQNFYMVWKFAVNLTPQQHLDLDSTIASMDNSMDAIDAILEFGMLHDKINLESINKDMYMKPVLYGGAKDKGRRLRKKAQKLAQAKEFLRHAKKPGDEGFNAFVTDFYSQKGRDVVSKILATTFKCQKVKNKYWRLEPYQKSAIFLGSQHCQFVKNLLVVHATGSGKTPIIHKIISSYMHDDRVKLFVTPSSEIRSNFYSQIKDFDTLLAKYVSAYPYPAEKLLTFAPRGPAPFHVQTYKNTYLGSVLNTRNTETRQQRAREVFGKEAYMPYAPIRSVDMEKLATLYDAVSSTDMEEFVDKARLNKPCVVERTNGQTGLHDLVTLRHDYGWDAKAREVVNGEVHNPFNNRIILIDEVDQLFQSLDNPKRRMLIYLLKFAQNSVVIGFTATPLVQGDDTYSTTTSKLLEMIKGDRGAADPLGPRAGDTCSNEGFVSYYNSINPPLYPQTIPYMGNETGRPVLGRIIFSQLRQGNLKKYQEAVKGKRGRDPQVLVKDHDHYRAYMSYATAKYPDRWAKQQNMKAMSSVVKDFEQNANKLSCLFRTLQQHKTLKTVVLFTAGLESFRTFVKMKHPDLYYDVGQGKYSAMRIGFIIQKDPNTPRVLKAFNRDDNLRGENMMVICADRHFAVGVNFRNARRLIKMSPDVDASRYIQSIGRVLRMCTYSKLPKDEQNVRIDIMVATIDPRRTLAQMEDATTYDELVERHVRSADPVLTVDEVALRILIKDVQGYRKRMQTIFAAPAIDKTWIHIPDFTGENDVNELEAVCTSSGVKRAEEAHVDPDNEFSYQAYTKDRYKEPIRKGGDPRKEMEAMNPLDKKHGAIGRKRHDQNFQNSRGIGIPKIEPYRAPLMPKELPVLEDAQEIKLAEGKFRNLSVPSIKEAELDKYSKEMRIPNMPVQTFVYENAKQLGEIKETMMQYSNALVLARDNYPKVQNFGQGDNFNIQVLIAEAAKKWIELAKYYNTNFVGGDMAPWNKVIGVNLYYLRWKNRVYVQYEPNVRVVRPVLFTNLKAWLESLGDKVLTNLDFHRIYQAMPEFRRAKDRVRYANAQNKAPRMKVNSDGTVDVVVEIKVPGLAGHHNQISAREALAQPESYHAISQLYSEILADHFNVGTEQVRGHLDGQTHLVFHVYRINQDMLNNIEFEESLNQDLLDPDPGQRQRIPVKTMEGEVEDYVLMPRFDVDASTITKYIRYAVGANLPKRDKSNRTPHGSYGLSKDRYKGMFQRGIDPYASSKEILNRNNGNVWIMVGQDQKFKIFDTLELPTNATVDPYRSQPKFQEAKNRNDLYVLLDHVKPWQMAITRPYASIKQFALHGTDEEWTKFWEACLEIKRKYEDEHLGLGLMHPGRVLYMYTDAQPSLAQFHVNFSINPPHTPKEVPKVQPVPQKVVPTIQVDPKEQDKQKIVQKKHVQFAENLEKREFREFREFEVSKGCAKVGDQVYMVVINITGIYGLKYAQAARVLTLVQGGVFDLPHDVWKKDRTPEESVDEYLGKEIAFDTPALGLASFSDVQDTLDLSDGQTCVRILINFTDNDWNTTRSSHKVEFKTMEDFWKLKPQSAVMRSVQKNMKSLIDRYFVRLEAM